MRARRILDFASMDEIMPEVERLGQGHTTAGRWTLAQIVHHLAISIRLSTLGRAGGPAPQIDEDLRRQFFATRRFPEGFEAPHRRLIPPGDADFLAAAGALHTAVGRFTSSTGPYSAHPWLGAMSRAEWIQFHCIHSAHHLGYVHPLGLPAQTRTKADHVLDEHEGDDIAGDPQEHL